MAHMAQATQRRASFVEEKRLAALSVPLRAEGTLEYRKPDHLEKITTTPRYESLVVDGNRLVINGNDNDAPHVVELDGQPEIRALIDTIRGALSGDLGLLRRLYDVSGTGTVAGWHIVLRPRDAGIARVVKEVELSGGADLRVISSVAPNGDTDTLTITPTS